MIASKSIIPILIMYMICIQCKSDKLKEREEKLKQMEIEIHKREMELLRKEAEYNNSAESAIRKYPSSKSGSNKGKTSDDCAKFLGYWQYLNFSLEITTDGENYRIKSSRGEQIKMYNGSCAISELRLAGAGAIYYSDGSLFFNDREYKR